MESFSEDFQTMYDEIDRVVEKIAHNFLYNSGVSDGQINYLSHIICNLKVNWTALEKCVEDILIELKKE